MLLLTPGAVRRRRRSVAALLTTAACLPAAAAAAPGALPPEVVVPAGHKPFLTVHAVGDQVYTCNGTAWGPSTPRADLVDHKGKVVGTHYGGPTWRYKDGSRVVAQRDDGATVDPTAIPWLRLRAVDTARERGGDRFTATTWIQRLATTGGLAPAAADCTPARAGVQRAVPYTADYVFWKATGG